jgi:hypothetical protein
MKTRTWVAGATALVAATVLITASVAQSSDVSTTAKLYQIQGSDTLDSVAALYNTSRACVAADNGQASGWNPAVGQIIFVMPNECVPPTTTTAAPTTTTTVAPTTTTTTTLPPTTTTTVPNAAACGLTSTAFCETFSQAFPVSRSGQLNNELWGVSRLGDDGGATSNILQATQVTGCGSNAFVSPPNDVQVCNGRMFESLNDDHRVVNLATYPKQPFDFTGRTGKVAFDVSMDSAGTHAAWPEFWITDRPVPAPRGSISTAPAPVPRYGVGFAMEQGRCFDNPAFTRIGRIFQVNNYQYSERDSGPDSNCIQKATATSVSLNHVEVRISTTRIDVYATNPGSSALNFIGGANLNLQFSKGLVWLNDAHYNASKGDCLPTCQDIHTFAWDNLGFDGPKTYRDLSFDVPDAGTTNLGYQVNGGQPRTLTPKAVFRRQTPTGAIVTFNYFTHGATIPTVQVNNGTISSARAAAQQNMTGWYWQTADIDVPLADVHDGANTVTFRSGPDTLVVSNVNLILIAGAPVP